jgi:hypothetical protein
MARVPASEATRNRIEQMMNGAMGELDRSELIREAARLIVEEALEGDTPRNVVAASPLGLGRQRNGVARGGQRRSFGDGTGTPLLFARHAIMVSIHLHVGAISQEERSFSARSHL